MASKLIGFYSALQLLHTLFTIVGLISPVRSYIPATSPYVNPSTYGYGSSSGFYGAYNPYSTYGGYGKPSYSYLAPYGGYGISGYEGPPYGMNTYWQPGVAYPPIGYSPSMYGASAMCRDRAADCAVQASSGYCASSATTRLLCPLSCGVCGLGGAGTGLYGAGTGIMDNLYTGGGSSYPYGGLYGSSDGSGGLSTTASLNGLSGLPYPSSSSSLSTPYLPYPSNIGNGITSPTMPYNPSSASRPQDIATNGYSNLSPFSPSTFDGLGNQYVEKLAYSAPFYCRDSHIYGCQQWAAQGLCQSVPEFMLNYCRASCGVCSGGGQGLMGGYGAGGLQQGATGLPYPSASALNSLPGSGGIIPGFGMGTEQAQFLQNTDLLPTTLPMMGPSGLNAGEGLSNYPYSASTLGLGYPYSSAASMYYPYSKSLLSERKEKLQRGTTTASNKQLMFSEDDQDLSVLGSTRSGTSSRNSQLQLPAAMSSNFQPDIQDSSSNSNIIRMDDLAKKS